MAHHDFKVIGIGFHKTGTTTLETVLQQLGYSVLGPRVDLANKLFQNKLNEVLEETKSYDALQDNPWPILFKELDAHYPNSKFILTIRDEEKWIKSIVNHCGSRSNRMREYIYGEGKGNPRGNEDIYLERYKQHNQSVREHFSNRENDLLVVSWEKGDGWEKICKFLEKRIPNEPFPHANRGNYKKKSKGIKYYLGFLKKKFLNG